ncbi:succinate dehydrogenase assembly factor 2 [Litoreibacter roseus]|uniref:FAD assembly factor SdhE n=1 Tax=Litoreibacter roseus TaxID=2601869 RepID=A0A6N6JEC1_9RHOB|nr:succinate dehydrogenase assembly factor 2 [Litoreibacter roseus]GFE63638.1 succinate dehydrogenase assembly factor 2 [Litoreibacter roseus]
MGETREIRLKRLRLRSWRRGIKEMDLILGGFANAGLSGLTDAELELYDQMLEENDHDLYQWASGQSATPAAYDDLMRRIVRETTAI